MSPKSVREARDEYKCYEAKDGFAVSEISHEILKHLRKDISGSFQTFFNDHVPDLAAACDALAYKAMYDHLEKFKVNIYSQQFN